MGNYISHGIIPPSVWYFVCQRQYAYFLLVWLPLPIGLMILFILQDATTIGIYYTTTTRLAQGQRANGMVMMAMTAMTCRLHE